MAGISYDAILKQLFECTADYESDVVANYIHPRQKYQNEKETLEKDLDDLLNGPIRDKDAIKRCSYECFKIENEYRANADRLEAEWQLQKKAQIIFLLHQHLDIIGPSLLDEILQARNKAPLRITTTLDTESERQRQREREREPSSRNASATSQSQRAQSDSIAEPSSSGSDAGSNPIEGLTTPATSKPKSTPEASPILGKTQPQPQPQPQPQQHRQPSATKASPSSEKAMPPAAKQEPIVSRSIDFDHVYNATVRDVIVEYPKHSDNYYIVYCAQHGTHFHGDNPLAGGSRHLSSKKHNQSGTHDDVIRMLGYYVKGCTHDLALMHNKAVRENTIEEMARLAQKKYFGRGRKRRREDDLDSSEENSALRDGSTAPPHRSNRRSEGILDPVVGEVYLVYWEGDRRWYAGVVLSANEHDQPPISPTTTSYCPPSLSNTELLDAEKPACYTYDDKSRICGWAPGFEDGGPRALEREFPVMFFDHDKFPDSCQTAWIQPRSLKVFDDVPKDTPFVKLVQDYLEEWRRGPQTMLHFGDEIAAIQKRFAAPVETTVEEPTSQSQAVEKQPSPAKSTRNGPPPPTAQTASPTPQPVAKAAQQDQEPKQRDSQYARSLFRSMFDSGETSDTVTKEREARARAQSQEKRQTGGPQHRRSDSDLDSRPSSQPTKTEEQSPTTTSQRLAEAPPYQHQHQQQQQPPASVAQPTQWLPTAMATAAASTTVRGPYAGPHTAPSQYATNTTRAGFARAETRDPAKVSEETSRKRAKGPSAVRG
jgi:hypothetical protein